MSRLQELYNTIVSKSKKELLNYSLLRQIIRNAGLYMLKMRGQNKRIYGSADFYPETDLPHVSTDGIIIQKPDELAAFMLHVSRYRIKSYCEIGVFKSGLAVIMTAFLSVVNDGLDEAVFLDPKAGPAKDLMFLADHMNVFFDDNSEGLKGTGFDLCFIDGDHSYEWVKKDWSNIGKFSKITAFHDILQDGKYNDIFYWRCDVKKYWQELKKEVGDRSLVLSIAGPPEEFLGIGVIHNDQASLK